MKCPQCGTFQFCDKGGSKHCPKCGARMVSFYSITHPRTDFKHVRASQSLSRYLSQKRYMQKRMDEDDI